MPMKLLYIIFLLLPIYAFAEECIFDENAYFEFRNKYLQKNNNAQLSRDKETLIVSRNEKIEVTGGGCDHLGISIKSVSPTIYTEEEFLAATQALATEFGSWLLNANALNNSFSQRQWQNINGIYFFEIDAMTVFSASYDGGTINVDFYIN